MSFYIDAIKNSTRTYIIAEMPANHAGSLEWAKEIVHAASEAGADCIKIQTYTPDTMTIDCDKDYFRIRGGTWRNPLSTLSKSIYSMGMAGRDKRGGRKGWARFFVNAF